MSQFSQDELMTLANALKMGIDGGDCHPLLVGKMMMLFIKVMGFVEVEETKEPVQAVCFSAQPVANGAGGCMKPDMKSKYPYYCPCNCHGNVSNCVYADKGFRDWVVKQPDYEAATHNAGIADKLYREFQKVSYETNCQV